MNIDNITVKLGDITITADPATDDPEACRAYVVRRTIDELRQALSDNGITLTDDLAQSVGEEVAKTFDKAWNR